MTAIIHDYRDNPRANKAWSKMDTGEEVVARVNGLPITRQDLTDHSPCEFYPGDAMYEAPPKDPA
jgi:hypothetical protein